MTGKIIIVTGANSGIGFEAAKYLAEGGNDVTLACKDPEKGEEAVTKIKVLYPSALVQFIELNLSSTSSIKHFVKEFTKTKRKLNVLINNAGVLLARNDLTPHMTTEGFEYTMVSNYFGHFLLTHLLLDYLAQTAVVHGESRVINVTCASHDPHNSWFYKDLEELNPGNLQLLKNNSYTGAQAYKNSKLCSILFTYRLAEAVKNEHVNVVAVDPGYIPTTNLQRHFPCFQRFLSICCLHKCLKCAHITNTIKRAALQIVDLATSEKFEGVTGKFFKNGKPERSSLESYDTDLQWSVWKESCKLLLIRGSMTAGDMFDKLSLK